MGDESRETFCSEHVNKQLSKGRKEKTYIHIYVYVCTIVHMCLYKET